jgi:hypothetical protein
VDNVGGPRAPSSGRQGAVDVICSGGYPQQTRGVNLTGVSAAVKVAMVSLERGLESMGAVRTAAALR